MEGTINTTMLQEMEERFLRQDRNRVAMNAAVSCGLQQAAASCMAPRETRHSFSISLQQGDITNQKQSGRCWMFAALNTMRFRVMKKLGLKTFELSQAYPLFYDKLEKANYFLENILKTLEEPTEGRLIAWLLSAPLGDGGQWDMFAALVEKYGVVPKEAMPESVSSSATSQLAAAMTEKLREDACILRSAHRKGASMEDLRAKKAEMLEEQYRMLCIALGTPPTRFTFEVRTDKGEFLRDADITPQTFYQKYVDMDLSQYISLINAPTQDKPFDRTYTVKFLGNVLEGRPVKYLNLTAQELKAAAIAQLKDGEPVWFGCDVGKRSVRDTGLMDLNAIDLEGLFDVKFGMDKGQRLEYGQSLMTHAMVLQGVNLDENGQPNRWRVENSWGKDPGREGYYVMTDDWFTEYTYQVVVNKKYLTEAQKQLWEQEPLELEPWDPMGSLA